MSSDEKAMKRIVKHTCLLFLMYSAFYAYGAEVVGHIVGETAKSRQQHGLLLNKDKQHCRTSAKVDEKSPPVPPPI